MPVQLAGYGQIDYPRSVSQLQIVFAGLPIHKVVQALVDDGHKRNPVDAVTGWREDIKRL